jgi:hypothetical protein
MLRDSKREAQKKVRDDLSLSKSFRPLPTSPKERGVNSSPSFGGKLGEDLGRSKSKR